MNKYMNELRRELGDDYETELTEVVKNGNTLEAVGVRKKGTNIAACVYKYVTEEFSPAEVAEMIKENEPTFSVDDLTNKETLIKNAGYKLLKNNGTTKPDFLDLHIERVACFEDEQGTMLANLTDDYMKAYDISPDEFDTAAMKNIEDETLLYKMAQMPFGSMCMWVLTNSRMQYGAVSMLNKKTIAEFADEIEDDLYILPSSIHEVLIMQKTNANSLESLRYIVKEVNDTALSPEEILSYSVYEYKRETGEIRIANE